MRKNVISLIMAALVIFAISCKKDSTSTPTVAIPADPGTPVPTTTVNNLSSSIANPSFTTSGSQVSMLLSGVMDPNNANSFISFNGTGGSQNFWIEEDGVNKGCVVQSIASAKKSGQSYLLDLVFIVDNSGSMDQEADGVAQKINAFTAYLQTSGFNLKTGVVGYDESGEVTGAINFTTAALVEKYLNRETGTDRTVGFSGQDSTKLEAGAYAFSANYSGSENPIPSVLFADSAFTWRAGSPRIYIVFTDEPGQPYLSTYSSSYNCPEKFTLAGFKKNWKYSQGTVHTVFSVGSYDWNGAVPDTANCCSWNKTDEFRPWELSTFTGGASMFIHSDASDLDLTTLKTTKVLAQSFVVKFNSASVGGTHNLKIVIKGTGGNASDGLKTIQGVKYQ